MLSFMLLLFFIVGFAVLIGATSWHLASKVPVQNNPESLQAIHWALLNGGRRRAALAAFTQQLVERTVVWDEDERRYNVEQDADPAPSFDLIKARAPIKEVLQSLEETLAPYEKELQDWGLWVDDEHWNRRKQTLKWAGIISMLGIGVASIFELINEHRFLSYLPYFAFLQTQMQKKPPQPTREGHRLLKRYKKDHPFKIGSTPDSLLPNAVAIDGENALYDSPYAVLIWVLATQN